MWRTLGIDETDWQHTSPAVQIKLRSQYHEIHSLKLRSVSTQKQIATLAEPAGQIERLNRRIAFQQNQILQLQQQLTSNSRFRIFTVAEFHKVPPFEQTKPTSNQTKRL